MTDLRRHENLLALYDAARHDLRIFMETVLRYIGDHPELTVPGKEVVHSYKSRLKDREHFRDKISRKIAEGRNINESNLFTEITDLAGVRILHLFQEDFVYVDRVVRKKVTEGDWCFGEPPKAYTWDPENVEFFRGFDLVVSEKPTSYTSVHYLIKPRLDSPICCELQVRTLFEEIWGEVDHRINYPSPTESIACREQIKVLSKVVGAGSRLLDALRRVDQRTETAADVDS
jgi:ppGpp synthetase/RelA/SpoT-type nucleotidyltranferase